MPKPMADETEEKYISRCMGDEHMSEKYPDNDQRAAVCYAYWDKKDAPDNPEEYTRRELFHGDHDQSTHGRESGAVVSVEDAAKAYEKARDDSAREDDNATLSTKTDRDIFNDRGDRRLAESTAQDAVWAVKSAKDNDLSKAISTNRPKIQEAITRLRAINEKYNDRANEPKGEVGGRTWGYMRRSSRAGLEMAEAGLQYIDARARQAGIKMSSDSASQTFDFARMDDVELFAVGTWNGLPFTESDLDGIVSAFDALNLSGRVPLKLGHDGPDARRDPLTQLAMGWVQSVKRVGDKLLGTIEVPDKVRSLFKEGYLKFVSIELLKDVKASTRKIPWVLDAVALLGADQPAVGILGDLQSVTMARSELEFESCVSFARDDMRPFHSINGDTIDMSNDKTALQELSDKLLALSAQVNDLQAENRKLKSRDAEFAQTKARFERLQDDVKRKEIEAHREKIAARVESAVKAEDITPAARERFNKVYRVDDDGAVMSITLEDVEEFVRENPNPHKKKPRTRTFTSLASPDADIPVDVPVDVEAAMRVEAFLRQTGVKAPTDRDIQAAAVAMFKSNPELGARYKAAADAQYGK